MVNFGIAYGLSAFGLADRLQISREEAAAYIQRYFERFPAVKAFIDETIARAERDGFVTRCWAGAAASRSSAPDSASAGRSASGWRSTRSIQGTAADIIKLAMVRCHARAGRGRHRHSPGAPDPRRAPVRGPGRRDGCGAAELVRREMCAAFDLDPPLAVDVGIGADWLAAK